MTTLGESAQSWEQRLENAKTEHGQDLTEKVQKIQEDKERYEKKYNEKRSAFKDLENRTQVHIQNIEREKAVLDEKLKNTEKKSGDELVVKN